MSWVEKNWKPLTVVGGLIGLSWFAGKKFDEADMKRLTITAESFEEGNCLDCDGKGRFYDSYLGKATNCSTCEGKGKHKILGYKDCCYEENIRVHHRGGAIYHDEAAELTYYPAECMVCGREYEAGLPMYSSSTEIVKLEAESFDADSVSDLKLQKDSCCCGATKKNPCLCMIQGTEQCSAKAPMCPCYAEIAMGTKVEMEHTKSREKAEKIAKEHLSEHPDYYSRLKKAGLSAETFNATTNSKKSEIVPFSPNYEWMGNDFPLLDHSHSQMISKIVDGEVLKEPNSIVVNYPISRRDIEPITMKWGELFKICKENSSKKIYTVSFGEGGQKYDTPHILSAFKYLPKKTVLTIYADHNYPLEVIFDYGGEKWVYRQRQTIKHEEHKPKKTQRRGRKKNRNRIKTRFEMDPDMRLNSASNPNNPSVGSIEKECLVEGCSEKVRVNHETEGKRCFKCYNDMMEERGYYRRPDTRYVKGEKRPPWDENLMEGAIVKDEDGSFERFSKDKAVLLFRKSGKSEQLKSLLRHINSMNYELLSNEGLRELLLDLRTYRTLDLGDNGESGEYIVIDDTPFSRNHFHQMLRELPPLTKLRISGKRDSPLMVEFKYLGEEYIMFLAPYEVDYEDSRMVKSVENHPEFPFWVVKKPNPEKMEKDFQDMLNEDRRKATERVKKRERLRKLQKEARKVMTPEESEEIWNLRVSRKIGVDEELAFYEDILRERKEAETFNAEDRDLAGADLRSFYFVDANLEGANLEGADLSFTDILRANLRNANLQGANLFGADLQGANLRGAWLRNADLRNAKLHFADLRNADLRNANLRGANLPFADLRGANLEGADFRGAKLSEGQREMIIAGGGIADEESFGAETFEAEMKPTSYMVKSDAHKLNEAARRIHEKADEHQKYPEWWKSKLSVSRNNADQLADFLDYAVIENVFASEGHDHDDHDHEDIDELIAKLNTVVDFAITFIHDGGYGGEPKGIFVDDDLGIKTEVVEYVEGSIQLRLVRDIETNELLSVRFSLTGNPEETPIVYLPLPEKLTTIPDDERSSK